MSYSLPHSPLHSPAHSIQHLAIADVSTYIHRHLLYWCNCAECQGNVCRGSCVFSHPLVQRCSKVGLCVGSESWFNSTHSAYWSVILSLDSVPFFSCVDMEMSHPMKDPICALGLQEQPQRASQLFPELVLARCFNSLVIVPVKPPERNIYSRRARGHSLQCKTGNSFSVNF